MPTLAEQQAAITQKQQAQEQEAQYLTGRAEDIKRQRAEVEASQKQTQERAQQAEERQKKIRAQADVITRMGGSTAMYAPVATVQIQKDVADVQSAVRGLDIRQSKLNVDIEDYNKRASAYKSSSAQLKSEIDVYNQGVDEVTKYNQRVEEVNKYNRAVEGINVRYRTLQPISNYAPATTYTVTPEGVVKETFRAWQTGMYVTNIINPSAGTVLRPEYGVTGRMVKDKADTMQVERAKLAIDVKNLLNINLEYGERFIPQPFTSNRPLSDESLKLITAPAGTITDIKLAEKAGVITEQEAAKMEYLGRGTAQFAKIEDFQKAVSSVPATLTESKGVLVQKELIGIESRLVAGKPLTPNEQHALLGSGLGWLPSVYKQPQTQFEMPAEINPATGERWTAPMSAQERQEYYEKIAAPTLWWQSLSTPEKGTALFAGAGIDFGVATSYLSKKFGWGQGFEPNAFSLESAKMGETTVNYYQITPSKEHVFAEWLYNTLDINKGAPVLERLGTGMYKAATGSFAVTAASVFAFGAGVGALSRFAPRVATAVGYGAIGSGVADIAVKTYFKDYSSAVAEAGVFAASTPFAASGFRAVGGQVAPLSSFVPSVTVPKVVLPRIATAVNTAIESALMPVGKIVDIASVRSITAREMFGLSKGYATKPSVVDVRPLYQKMFGSSFKESAEAKWWREPTEAYTQAQFKLYNPFESPLGRTSKPTPTEVIDVRPLTPLGDKAFGRFDLRSEIKALVGEPAKPSVEVTPVVTKMFGRGKTEVIDLRSRGAEPLLTKMFGETPIKDPGTQWWREPNPAYVQAQFEKFDIFAAEGRALEKRGHETIDLTPQLSFKEKTFGTFSVRNAIKDLTKITPYPPKPEKPDVIDVRPLKEKMFGSPKKGFKKQEWWRAPTPAYEGGQYDIYNPLESGRKLAKPEVTFIDVRPWYEKAFGISRKAVDTWWKDPVSSIKHITGTGAARARAYQEWYANTHPVEGGERAYVEFNPRQSMRLPAVEVLKISEKRAPELKMSKDLTQGLHKKWNVREKDMEKQVRSGEFGVTKEGQVVLTKLKPKLKLKEKAPTIAIMPPTTYFIDANKNLMRQFIREKQKPAIQQRVRPLVSHKPVVTQKQQPFTTTKPFEVVIPRVGTGLKYRTAQLPALSPLEKLVQKEIAIQQPRLDTPTTGRPTTERIIVPVIAPPKLDFGNKVPVKRGRKATRRATSYEIRNVFAGLKDLIGG